MDAETLGCIFMIISGLIQGAILTVVVYYGARYFGVSSDHNTWPMAGFLGVAIAFTTLHFKSWFLTALTFLVFTNYYKMDTVPAIIMAVVLTGAGWLCLNLFLFIAASLVAKTLTFAPMLPLFHMA